jgi:excisionase family DNA binding protein
MYRISQAAKMLGRSRQTIMRYIELGLLDVAEKGAGRTGAVWITAKSIRRLERQQEALIAGTYDTGGAAKLLCCDRRTVQRLVKSGHLTAKPSTVGHGLRISADSLARYRGERCRVAA